MGSGNPYCYVLKGWSDSKDLRKVDPAVLLKEIMAAYQEYGDLLKAKDAEGLTRLVYQKEKDYAQALFLDQKGSKKQWYEGSPWLHLFSS